MNYRPLLLTLCVCLAMLHPRPADATTLVAQGSVWKYLDNGTDQGTAWRTGSYDDDNWASGPAQLGYGDGDEATVVSYGTNAANKYVTTYFRQDFTVVDPGAFTNLVLRLLRDDGAVVYINGVEVFRSNMPGGAINYLTPASSSVAAPAESAFYTNNVNPTNLIVGVNLIRIDSKRMLPWAG